MFEALHREFPDNAEYRQQVAWSHFLLCRTLWGRDPEADVAVKRSFDLYDGLVAQRSAVDQPAVEAMMVYYRTGEMLERAGRLDEAEQAFQRAIAVHEQRTERAPSDPETRYYVAGWDFAIARKRVAAGRMKEAATLFSRGLKVYPDEHGNWYQAAPVFLS